jgi:hypothetical protein
MLDICSSTFEDCNYKLYVFIQLSENDGPEMQSRALDIFFLFWPYILHKCMSRNK